MAEVMPFEVQENEMSKRPSRQKDKDTQKSKNMRVLMDDYGWDRRGIENVFQTGEKHGKKQ